VYSSGAVLDDATAAPAATGVTPMDVDADSKGKIALLFTQDRKGFIAARDITDAVSLPHTGYYELQAVVTHQV